MSIALRLACRTFAWVPAVGGIGIAASKLVESVNGSTPPGLSTSLAGFVAAALVVGAAFLSLAE